MTLHKILTIEPEDVRAIQLECADCHAKLSVPIAKAKESIPNKCPVCQSEWSQTGRLEQNSIMRLADGLNDIVKLATGRAFHVRFAADEPKSVD